MAPVRAFRNFGNILGVAWWAKVETKDPDVVYWFGPFITRTSLKKKLRNFLDDLSLEGPDSIKHTFVRGRRNEPFTS